MTGGGWLTAKKRGRDDEQIERDKEAALVARRARRGRPGGAAAGLAARKKRQAAPKQRGRVSSKKQKMDSLAGFVVDSDDDDDEEEQVWEESSSEEEVLQVDPPKKYGTKTLVIKSYEDSDEDLDELSEMEVEVDAPKAAKKNSNYDDDSESSSEETFFPTVKTRTSKPPPPRGRLLQKKGPALKKRPALKTKKADVVDELYSSSSDNDESAVAAKPPAISNKANGLAKSAPKVAATKAVALDDDDADGSDHSTPFTKKANTVLSLLKDSSDEDSLDSSSKFFDNATTKSKFFAKVVDDLKDTPVVPAAIRKKLGKKQQEKKVTKASKQPNITADDYCSDIDEAVAIACALEESTKTAKKVSAASSPGGSSAGDPVELQDDSSSSEQEQDANEQADYEDDDDDDARAASSILATANELSAQVLKTMAGWSKGATDGMIVDGALALYTTGGDNGKDDAVERDHTWISLETMKEILPDDVTLSEYQLIGINWLALLHGMKCEVEGTKKYTNVNGILADEMGLGKTCQTIAFLSWLKHIKAEKKPRAAGTSKEDAVELEHSDDDEQSCPHLVIAPASVVSNWELEFEKFAPQLNVVKYHGTMDERMEIQMKLKRFLPGGHKPKGATLDVILAPVTYFQQEKTDDRVFLRRFKYDYMVVDEAHLLKNARGMRYRSLDRFSTMHRLLLTGTPVQNSPKELMSLLCFLMPLFSRRSGDDSDDNRGHDGGESMLQYFVSMQDGAENNDQAAYKKLKQLFSPFVLRRRKQDVLRLILPPKVQRVEFVELDSASRLLYNSVIADHVQGKKKGTVTVNDHLFTQLRKAAHHPLMLRSRYTTAQEKEHLTHWFFQSGAFRGEGCTKAKVAEELEKFTDFDIHLTASELIDENPLRRKELGRYILDEQDLFCSAKFVRLQKLLPELIKDGHRILIFSVWTTCLDLLSCLLEQMGLGCLRMDGQTSVSDRQSLIDQFNRDTSIPIFLLSTKACGLGLNLTSADTCIQHDLDFNPFNDLQAEDRCHRIGQSKTVTVIKLVAQDTVDEDIYAMQQRKAKMNAAIMGSDAEWNKHAKSDQNQVLEIAVNRFLQSPKASTGRSPAASPQEKHDQHVKHFENL